MRVYFIHFPLTKLQSLPAAILLSLSLHRQSLQRAYINKELHLLNSQWAKKPKQPV
jgi:hypothetical protein